MISYTAVDGEHVAYAVGGEGPDILWIQSLGAGNAGFWDEAHPTNAWYRQLQRSCRTITFDRRGSGLSDQPWRELHLDDWVTDAVAVLDAVGSARCTIVSTVDGALAAIPLAALHPDRVTSLVLIDPFVRTIWAPDFPLGHRPEEAPVIRAAFAETWGRDDVRSEDALNDDEQRQIRRSERQAGSPAAFLRAFDLIGRADARPYLDDVQAPITIVHSAHGQLEDGGVAAVVERCPHAAVIEAPETLRLLQKIAPTLVDTIRRCALGDHGSHRVSRSIGTVVFADVFGSTDLARELGDDAWRHRLDEHDHHVGVVASANGGRVVNRAGDGALILFDSPAGAIAAAGELVKPHTSLLPLRVGIHAGEIEHRGDDIAGIAVHVGARVGALAASREVLVSRTVRDLVAGSGIAFEPRGSHALKGLDEEWDVYALT